MGIMFYSIATPSWEAIINVPDNSEIKIHPVIKEVFKITGYVLGPYTFLKECWGIRSGKAQCLADNMGRAAKKTCPVCDGRGTIKKKVKEQADETPIDQPSPLQEDESSLQCPRCEGEGTTKFLKNDERRMRRHFEKLHGRTYSLAIAMVMMVIIALMDVLTVNHDVATITIIGCKTFLVIAVTWVMTVRLDAKGFDMRVDNNESMDSTDIARVNEGCDIAYEWETTGSTAIILDAKEDPQKPTPLIEFIRDEEQSSDDSDTGMSQCVTVRRRLLEHPPLSKSPAKLFADERRRRRSA